MAPQPDAVGPDRRQQCITPEGQAERCRVLLRFRPPPAMDLGKGVDAPGTPFEAQGETVTVRPRDGVEDVSFTFDKVFPDSATQDDVFQSVMHDSVTSVLTVCTLRTQRPEHRIERDREGGSGTERMSLTLSCRVATQLYWHMGNPAPERLTPCSVTTGTVASSRAPWTKSFHASLRTMVAVSLS